MSFSDDSISRMTSESTYSSSNNTSSGRSEDGDVSETDRGELIDILCCPQERTNLSLKRSRDIFERQVSQNDSMFYQNINTVSYDFSDAVVSDKIELYQCLYGAELDVTDTEGELNGMLRFWPETDQSKDIDRCEPNLFLETSPDIPSTNIADQETMPIEIDKDHHFNFCNMIDDLNIDLAAKVDDPLFDSFHRERTLSAQFDSPSFVIPFSHDDKQSVYKSLSLDTDTLPSDDTSYSYLESFQHFQNNLISPLPIVSFDQYERGMWMEPYSSFLTPKNDISTHSLQSKSTSISPMNKKRGRPRKDSDGSHRCLSKSSSSENFVKTFTDSSIATKSENPLILILKKNNSNNALNRLEIKPEEHIIQSEKTHHDEEIFVSGMLEAFE